MPTNSDTEHEGRTHFTDKRNLHRKDEDSVSELRMIPIFHNKVLQPPLNCIYALYVFVLLQCDTQFLMFLQVFHFIPAGSGMFHNTFIWFFCKTTQETLFSALCSRLAG